MEARRWGMQFERAHYPPISTAKERSTTKGKKAKPFFGKANRSFVRSRRPPRDSSSSIFSLPQPRETLNLSLSLSTYTPPRTLPASASSSSTRSSVSTASSRRFKLKSSSLRASSSGAPEAITTEVRLFLLLLFLSRSRPTLQRPLALLPLLLEDLRRPLPLLRS